MSKYTDFVKAHLKSAPGATQKDKFRAVAEMWKRQKGRGDGLHAPGVSGRGVNKFSDWGDRADLNGEGVKKRRGRGMMDNGIRAGMESKMLKASQAARGGKVAAMRMKRGGASTIAEKMYKKDIMGGASTIAQTMYKKGCYGAGLSGMMSKKQARALSTYIKKGGATSEGALAGLLHGLTVKVE